MQPLGYSLEWCLEHVKSFDSQRRQQYARVFSFLNNICSDGAATLLQAFTFHFSVVLCRCIDGIIVHVTILQPCFFAHNSISYIAYLAAWLVFFSHDQYTQVRLCALCFPSYGQTTSAPHSGFKLCLGQYLCLLPHLIGYWKSRLHLSLWMSSVTSLVTRYCEHLPIHFLVYLLSVFIAQWGFPPWL